jgi:hypothetical protein
MPIGVHLLRWISMSVGLKSHFRTIIALTIENFFYSSDHVPFFKPNLVNFVPVVSGSL